MRRGRPGQGYQRAGSLGRQSVSQQTSRVGGGRPVHSSPELPSDVELKGAGIRADEVKRDPCGSLTSFALFLSLSFICASGTLPKCSQ